MSGTCRCGAAPGCSASPVPPIHPGHSPTVHRHHRFFFAARLRLVHGFGAQQRPGWRGRRDRPARQRTLETGSSGAPVSRARLVRRGRRSRHSCVVNRYWTHDSGRRRRYLSRWRRGRLHRIHPGHPSASKAPALVLAAQVAAHARRSPRLAPGSVMNRPEPIRPRLAAATSAGTTRGPTLRRGQRPRPRAAMKKSTPATRSSRIAATLDHLWRASSPCVDASRTPAALPRSP